MISCDTKGSASEKVETEITVSQFNFPVALPTGRQALGRTRRDDEQSFD